GYAAGVAARGVMVVLRAAAVACQLADDVVLVGAVARAQDLTALAVEFGQVPTHTLHIRVELDAARGPAQGLGEQKLIPAVGTVELDLRRRQAAFGLAQLGLDPGQLLRIVSAAL